MIIADGHVFPVRSLAPARSLLPHSLRRAGICAVFISSFFPWSHQGKAATMTAWRLAARPSTRPAARVLVSPLCSLFIRAVASRRRQRFSHLSRLPACSRVPSCRSLRPFSISSRPSSRLASRRPSRSHAVSPTVPFSSRSVLPDVPNGLPHVLRSRRFVQLVSPFSSCFSVLSSPHDRMTQTEHGYRITVSRQVSKEQTR